MISDHYKMIVSVLHLINAKGVIIVPVHCIIIVYGVLVSDEDVLIQSLREAYNNFNSYLAILSAIESSAISRLEWPEKVIKVMIIAPVIFGLPH